MKFTKWNIFSNYNKFEFIQLIYLFGYYNGSAASINGGNRKWKDVFLPLIQNNDYEECSIVLNNILGEIESKKK